MKHLNIHAIGFKKGMIVCTDNGYNNKERAEALQYLLMRFGYVLSKEAFETVSKSSTEFIEEYASSVNEFLEDFIGSKRGYTLQDIYDKNIEGVRTSLFSFLYLIYDNHYKVPEGTKPLIKEFIEYKVINLGTEEKFKLIFTEMVSIETSLTPQDYETIKWFASTYGSENIMPKVIPFKENLCMLAALMMDVPVRTSTDVLRIAMFLSNGHTLLTLPPKMVRKSAWRSEMIPNPERNNFKFKSFRRAERRYLLGLLDKVAQPKEMVLRIGQWLRLGEVLHPGDYKKMFAKSYNAFNKLRNDRVYSWYSDVDKAFGVSFANGINKLSERPGEFARRLDSLVRKTESDKDLEMVLTTFLEVADKISSKVLWELYRHFNARMVKKNSRSITIPGARKAVSLPVLEPLSEELVESIQLVIFEGIKSKFRSLPSLGNVYIDDRLKDVVAPTNMRTMSDSLTTVTRGTRIPLDTHKQLLRPYVYWTAGVDVDLSVSFYDSNGNRQAVCSYGNPRPGNNIIHSGDVIPRHEGEWREYIDIPYKDVTHDYAVVTIRNFRGGAMADLGAIAGIAEFDDRQYGNEWLATAVKNAHKLETSGSNVILMAIDLAKKEYVMIDQDQAGIPVEIMQNNEAYLEYLLGDIKLSAYDILSMHMEVRGTKVEKPEEADTVFQFEDFSTSYTKLASYML